MRAQDSEGWSQTPRENTPMIFQIYHYSICVKCEALVCPLYMVSCMGSFSHVYHESWRFRGVEPDTERKQAHDHFFAIDRTCGSYHSYVEYARNYWFIYADAERKQAHHHFFAIDRSAYHLNLWHAQNYWFTCSNSERKQAHDHFFAIDRICGSYNTIYMCKMCNMTDLYVQHDSFLCVTWFILMCDHYVWCG